MSQEFPEGATLLPTEEVDGDQEFEMLMLDGTWLVRRIVWTLDFVYIARKGETVVVDSIPLAEADKIAALDSTQGSAGPLAGPEQNRPKRKSYIEKGSSRKIIPDESSASSVSENPELKAADNSSSLQITTIPEGLNSGRTYYFRVQSHVLCHQLADDFKHRAVKARRAAEAKSRFERSQDNVRAVFNSTACQSFAGILIFSNFLVNAAQAQLNSQLTNEDGSVSEIGHTLDWMDVAFTSIFTVELLVNMYAHWWRPFFYNTYNLVDTAVIALSLAALVLANLPVSVLRVVRAFRVIRLFGRLKSLRRIIGALTASLVPMFNSFVIVVLFMAIYAIIGVTYFSEIATDDFGAFDSAFVALFRVSAGDSWIDSLDSRSEEGRLNAGTITFVYTYVVVVNWTLIPVSFAVMVDSFVAESTKTAEEERQKKIQEEKNRRLITYTLDPLLKFLTTHYVDDADLSDRLQRLFKARRPPPPNAAARTKLLGSMIECCRMKVCRQV